jgi:hypothetical protein
MTEQARALPVPLATDSVAPFRLTQGSLALAGGSELERDVVSDALFFEVRDEGVLGRVTFEGLDALRASRGELAPYPDGNDFSSWVYVIDDSRWLQERHDYEWRNYQTPLLESHLHYVFRFHDDYVEALASGIWLDRPNASDPFRITGEHPFGELTRGDVLVEKGQRSGIDWDLWIPRHPIDELVQNSRLCSQRLFEFGMHLDGARIGVSGCWLRDRNGLRSRLGRSWVGEFASRDGIAKPEDFMSVWLKYCDEVAERRRAMGKS